VSKEGGELEGNKMGRRWLASGPSSRDRSKLGYFQIRSAISANPVQNPRLKVSAEVSTKILPQLMWFSPGASMKSQSGSNQDCTMPRSRGDADKVLQGSTVALARIAGAFG
jgi:hypothetical protein